MSWRCPRHELVDDQVLGDGCARLRCRCGWASPTVPAYGWDVDSKVADAVDATRLAAWNEHYAPLITPSPFQVLDLRRDGWGEWRHYLAGEAVHAGDGLDLLLPDGRWWSGRYESTWPPGWADTGPTAMFHASLGGPWIDNDTDHTVQVAFPLPATAVLRWPPDRWQR